MNNELTTLTDYIRDELGYDGEIGLNTDLLEEQILDSFSIIQVAVFIQEEFGLELDPEELVRENLSTLSSMIKLIGNARS